MKKPGFLDDLTEEQREFFRMTNKMLVMDLLLGADMLSLEVVQETTKEFNRRFPQGVKINGVDKCDTWRKLHRKIIFLLNKKPVHLSEDEFLRGIQAESLIPVMEEALNKLAGVHEEVGK